jgi:predicted SAM-dependent methyltransferase
MIDFLRKTGLYTPVRWTVKKSVPAFWVPYGILTGRTDRALAKYKRENKVHKLHIGCGGNYLKGWFNTDLFPNARRTKLDSTKTFPYPDNTFDYIFTEHMIEHVPYAAGQVMLRECYRVLKPGGILRLITPDVKFLMSLYNDREKQINKDYIKWNSELFFKDGSPHTATSVINNFYRDWGHRYIYDIPTMRDAMTKAGFSEIKEGKLNQSEHPEIAGLEHDQRMPAGFLELESMVIEAKKT